MSKFRVLPVLSITFVACLALAASPVGTWTGKVIAKMPPVPANTTPQQKAMMQQGMSMVSKMRIMLNLKADKTYTVTVSGLPGNGTKQKPESGTWSQKGNLVMTSTPRQGGKAQNLTLSADGKTMTLDAPGGRGKVIFTR